MIIPKEVIPPRHTGVAFKHRMRVQPRNERRGTRVLARKRGLAPDGEQVGDEVPIDEVRGVGREARGGGVHVEAYYTH